MAVSCFRVFAPMATRFTPLCERDDYYGPFLPGYRAVEQDTSRALSACFTSITWWATWAGTKWISGSDFYAHVMGFKLYQHFDDKDISTEYSSLMSKVMANGNGYVKFPINEPAEGKHKSQIEEYLDFYRGPRRAAHCACDKRHSAHREEPARPGDQFLHVPHTYYTELQDRVGKIDEPVEELEELGILVDRDDEGYMLQIFSRPVEDRPTLFFEIIQRKGSRSFGKGNFKALFEAIEREQRERGNL